jgi:hypothetical protein
MVRQQAGKFVSLAATELTLGVRNNWNLVSGFSGEYGGTATVRQRSAIAKTKQPQA